MTRQLVKESFISTYASEAWVTETIRFSRTLGFFTDKEDLSDREILANVARHYGGMEFLREELLTATSPATADQILLQADETRVWSRDLEGVYPGERFYETTLREWAAISRGAFHPEDITETWVTETGPGHVRFTVHGVPQTFTHVDGRDDFLDFEILALINNLLSDTPYRFERADDYPGDGRFVVVLRREEKALLASERGWDFVGSQMPTPDTGLRRTWSQLRRWLGRDDAPGVLPR